MDKAGGLPSGTLCCRHRHQYPMPPSDCLSAGTSFRHATYRGPRSDRRIPSGGGGSPQLPHRPSHHSAPLYAGGFLGAAFPGASRRPWPSPAPTGLGSPLFPLRGSLCRRGRLHVMLRTGELLTLHRGLCHGASPVGSRLAAAVSYRAAWSLPEPDLHQLVDVSFHENDPIIPATSSCGSSVIWVHSERSDDPGAARRWA